MTRFQERERIKSRIFIIDAYLVVQFFAPRVQIYDAIAEGFAAFIGLSG